MHVYTCVCVGVQVCVCVCVCVWESTLQLLAPVLSPVELQALAGSEVFLHRVVNSLDEHVAKPCLFQEVSLSGRVAKRGHRPARHRLDPCGSRGQRSADGRYTTRSTNRYNFISALRVKCDAL